MTFVNNLGNVASMTTDSLSLTGSGALAAVNTPFPGISPPFDSKGTFLPYGSYVHTDLSSLSFQITGLMQGVPFYVRVAAKNGMGKGAYKTPIPFFASSLPQAPSAPTNVELSVVDGDELRVGFSQPLRDGGNPVSKYKIVSFQRYRNELRPPAPLTR